MDEESMKIKKSLKEIAMSDGDPNGEWTDVGGLIRQMNRELKEQGNCKEHIIIELPKYKIQKLFDIAEKEQITQNELFEQMVDNFLINYA